MSRHVRYRAARLIAGLSLSLLVTIHPPAHAATVTVSPSSTQPGWWVYSGFSSAPNCGAFVRRHFPGEDYWCLSSNNGPWSVTVPHRID